MHYPKCLQQRRIHILEGQTWKRGACKHECNTNTAHANDLSHHYDTVRGEMDGPKLHIQPAKAEKPVKETNCQQIPRSNHALFGSRESKRQGER